MRIFLSYASERRAVAEPIALALRNRGHEVFLDKDDLPAGKSYGAQIEDAIKGSDLMIFLISPESVEQGRYTLSELEFARKHWRVASRKLLPVKIADTDLAKVPAFAKSVTILEPQGNIAAEVAAAADDLRGLEYAITVGLQVSLIALVFGLLSYFSFRSDGQAVHHVTLPFGGRLPAPEVGLVFSLPIGFAVWKWGLRHWWSFVVPVILVTACYLVSAPPISRLTLELAKHQTKDQTETGFQRILEKAGSLLDEADKKLLAESRDAIIGSNTVLSRISLGLLVGMLIAGGAMVSLGLVMPQFRSAFRWLVVILTGAVISGVDTFIVLQGAHEFSNVKAMLLITIWQVAFGFLLGYWLARGRTTVSD
ncbi:MAG: toll/interleukin-1 receptor domain-containing protein [Rhodomicrobium sp.]